MHESDRTAEEHGSELRVLVVDRFPIVWHALKTPLIGNGLAKSVDYASDTGAAYRKCVDGKIDIVVTDVTVAEDRDGIRLCGLLKNSARPPRVLVLSSTARPDFVASCVISGVDSFVYRTADPELAISAIAALTGEGQPIWFVGDSGKRLPKRDSSLDVVAANLTGREQEILSLVLLRLSNDEIAARLHLARQTVKNYVSCVLQKLEVRNRAELFTSPFGTGYIESVESGSYAR
ncbi:MAG: response regulator transcription factor [Nonomuraea sp.]|nr:response regulator transcription factor [Nonomuraea sp.]NUP67388.1 response regulator transcription factor [Nonomuraea sp.]